MASNPRLNLLKRQLERLRKDSLSVVATANKIVYSGVQQLADKELKALNDYYKSAVAAIKDANKGAGIRGLAQKQLDLLQETVNQVIGHARESMGIIAETRAELAKLVQSTIKGEKVTAAKLKQVVAPARKAVGKAKAAAKKAAGKAARKAGGGARKAAAKKTRGARRGAAPARSSAAPTVAKARPAPASRAGRATSKAKEAATGAVEAVGQAVSHLTENVSSAVSSAMHAVTDAVKPPS